MKLSKEEVQNRINMVHDSTILMSNYISTARKAKFKCLVCGYEWSTQPRSVYYLKTGCPMCSHTARITTEMFKQRVKDLVGDEYTVLSECNGRHSKIKMIHNKCGLKYEVEVGSFLTGKRCPNKQEVSERISNKRMIDKNEMLNKLNKSWGGEMVYVSGFTTVDNNATFKHIKCGKLFTARPRQLYSKVRGCTRCSRSKGEVAVSEYLDDIKATYIAQKTFADCRDKKPLPFDFVVFNDDKTINCAIEYQGIQHYKKVDYFGEGSWKSTTAHDVMKKKYCRDHRIKLICIPLPSKSNIKFDELRSYVFNYLDEHMSIPNQDLQECK